MKIHVDESKCQGHTLCVLAAPDLVQLREEDGHSYVLSEEVTPGQEAAARAAAATCPEQAISIS
jgi:ferredoxin